MINNTYRMLSLHDAQTALRGVRVQTGSRQEAPLVLCLSF